jgi:branched-chain amino acid transport system substrate-binding protein
VKTYTKPFHKGDHEALEVSDFRLARWKAGQVTAYEDDITRKLTPADFKK